MEKINGYTFQSRGLDNKRRKLLRELGKIKPDPLAPYGTTSVWRCVKVEMSHFPSAIITTNLQNGKKVTITIEKEPMRRKECILNIDISVYDKLEDHYILSNEDHRKYAYKHGYAPTRYWKSTVAIKNERGRRWKEIGPIWHGTHEFRMED